jgi:hypothetical protein
MHIQQKHERQQGARHQIGYFKEQVCSAFRGGFLSHLLSQSQEAQNEEYYDHDADDVKNVHVYSYGSMCGFNKKWRSNRKRIAMEQSSINLAFKKKDRVLFPRNQLLDPRTIAIVATLKDGAPSIRTLVRPLVRPFAQSAFRFSPNRVSHAPPVLQPEGVPCWLVDEC